MNTSLKNTILNSISARCTDRPEDFMLSIVLVFISPNSISSCNGNDFDLFAQSVNHFIMTWLEILLCVSEQHSFSKV